MLKDDFLYGARSAIQKAVRRGDLDLAATCMDVLWKDSKHRSWVQWRLPILVVEECWPLVAEMEMLVNKLQTLAVPDRYKPCRKFLLELVAMPKTKDPDAMANMPWHLWNGAPPGQPEWKKMHELKMHVGEHEGALLRLSDSLHQEMFKSLKEDEYACSGLSLLRSRARMGGLWGDRVMMLATMILVGSRGLDEKEINKKLHAARNTVEGHGGLKKKGLPWYVCDQHTALGRLAIDLFLKQEVPNNPKLAGLTKEKLNHIQFMCEGSWNPPSLVKFAPIKEKPSRWESTWWPQLMRLGLPFGQYSAKEVRELWKNEMAPRMKEYVMMAARQREEKYGKKGGKKNESRDS